jgi:polysaccharide pyruvyl transferase WcaK-like protein
MTRLTSCTHQMFNGLGAGNIGDEVMFIGFLNCVRPAAGSTVEVWTQDSQVVKWLPNNYSYIPWTDEQLCEALAVTAGTVLLVGDTPVSEDLGLGWPLQALSKRLGFCHQNNIPVHAVGVGVDLLKSPAAINIFKECYLPIRSWTVRSARCREALRALGVPDERIVVAADLAWLYEPTDDYREWAALKWTDLGIDLKRPLIGANIVNEVWGESTSVKENIALALDKAARHLGAQIAFLCNETREGDFFDAAASRQIMALMQEESVFVPNEYYHPDRMLSLLSHVSVSVSQRYHFTIESVLAGTVPVSFRRGQKMDTLLEDLAMSPAGTMTEVNPDELFSGIIDAYIRKDYWINHLSVVRKLLAARAKRNTIFVSQLT